MSGSERAAPLHSAGNDSVAGPEGVTFRPASQADIDQFYDEPPGFTMRAIIAELAGKVVAIAGTYRASGQIYGFSEMRPEMRSRKRDILRMVREAKPLLYRYPVVLAVASETERNAPRFLQWLGFEYFGPSEHGEVYIWTRS